MDLPDKLETFDERLSRWVSDQGFWFQVRYSLSGKGMRGRLMFHLLNLMFRFFIFLLICAIGLWIYLIKRTESASFIKDFKHSLRTGLSASEVEMRGFQRLQGQLEVSRFAAEGDNKTFYSALEARNIRCKMGLLDGVVGVWRPGIIAISKLDLDLRAGADDADTAAMMSKAFFVNSEKVEIRTFEIANANLSWGYSDRTKGSLESSSIKMNREGDVWRMIIKGGWFSQNWLERLEVQEMNLVCRPNEIFFEKAELKDGDGTVDLTGLRILTGERPKLEGVAKIRNLPIEKIIPLAARNYIEGQISGNFQIFGSTNNADGVGFEGQVLLDGKDMISMRDRVHILKALSVVDYSRNYHRVDFKEGSLQLRTIGGGLELSEVNLKSDDLFSLEGFMKVRLPTQKETDDAIARGDDGGTQSALAESEDEIFISRSLTKMKSDFSLKRAAQLTQENSKELPNNDAVSLFDRIGQNNELRRLKNQASERISRMLRYEGAFRVTLPGDVFERAKRLQQEYPIDASTGRVPIIVPLQGSLYEITLKQAEDFYKWRNQ
jgi:hypothetical protein